MAKIGVLGAGTWALALAEMLLESDHEVTVWSALGEEIDLLEETRVNPKLPALKLSPAINLTKKLDVVCMEKDILLFAVPSVFVRSTAAAAAEFVPDGQIIVDAGKGIEPDTLFTLTEVIRSEMSQRGNHDNIKLVALSGPTHAEEVAMGIPSTIVSACTDLATAQQVQDIFMNIRMRVYTNDDVRGVELCGALKNVIALAAGISDGLGYGDNTKAALITRGMAEIARLGRIMGCRERTFYGLAGIGDLIVTATSVHSRNTRAGYLIGQGYSAEEAAEQVGMVVEGLNVLPAAVQLSEKYHVELPIILSVNAVVNEEAKPVKIVAELMGREKKAEHPEDTSGF